MLSDDSIDYSDLSFADDPMPPVCVEDSEDYGRHGRKNKNNTRNFGHSDSKIIAASEGIDIAKLHTRTYKYMY